MVTTTRYMERGLRFAELDPVLDYG